MTATNHALTGAIIGLTLGNPWLALPAAFMSHFVLDVIPHFGSASIDVQSKGFRRYLLCDAALCVVLVAVLALVQPADWLLAAACAFAATAPDLLWIRQFLSKRTFIPNALERFLAGIQWFERPIGAAVEVAWFASASLLMATLVR